MDSPAVSVIGAGLAGCECALTLADKGIAVELYEMRPYRMTPAHTGESLAELVCSNSLKSMRSDSAAGLLKSELDALGSHLLCYARESAVAAGDALAVDRDVFSQRVLDAINSRDNISLIRSEVTELPDSQHVVIATGPLTSDALVNAMLPKVGNACLSFFDAAAPIVDADSLDLDILFEQSRYKDSEDQGGDYLNAPFEKEAYYAFIDELVNAQRVVLRDFERHDLFQACMPVEEVARKGVDALRFGALKPVGIVDPHTGRRPYAVVQLRAENRERTLFNLVGFQTNLTFGEQKRVFRMIPGLEHADFFRFGVMHRNTFIDAPRLLDQTLALRSDTRLRFAGQITGTEGYTESIATGLWAALSTYADIAGKAWEPLPATSALGSLLAYATSEDTGNYQPMHVNFGLVPPLESTKKMGKRERYQAYAERAHADMSEWLSRHQDVLGS